MAAASLYWNIQVTKIDLIEETRTALISYYNLLEMTRQWNTMHKGVYAEIKGNVLPNKYLYSDRSLIETKDGRKLSYINMHIMTTVIGTDRSKIYY